MGSWARETGKFRELPSKTRLGQRFGIFPDVILTNHDQFKVAELRRAFLGHIFYAHGSFCCVRQGVPRVPVDRRGRFVALCSVYLACVSFGEINFDLKLDLTWFVDDDEGQYRQNTSFAHRAKRSGPMTCRYGETPRPTTGRRQSTAKGRRPAWAAIPVAGTQRRWR